MNLQDVGYDAYPLVISFKEDYQTRLLTCKSKFYIAVFGIAKKKKDSAFVESRLSMPEHAQKQIDGADHVREFQPRFATFVSTSRNSLSEQVSDYIDFFGDDNEITDGIFFSTDNKRKAFELLCQIYHQNQHELWNAAHPTSFDDNIKFGCPICDKPKGADSFDVNFG